MAATEHRTNDLASAVNDVELSSPRSKHSKVSCHASIPEQISPIILGARKDIHDDDGFFCLDRPKQYRVSLSKRLSGRSARITESPPPLSLNDQRTHEHQSLRGETSTDVHTQCNGASTLIEQITAWLEEEKAKSNARRNRRRDSKASTADPPNDERSDTTVEARRRPSDASDFALALDKLEDIVETALIATPTARPLGSRHPSQVSKPSPCRRSKSSLMTVSSDNDFQEAYSVVPSCEAWLDNTRTLSFSGGVAGSEDNLEPKKSYAKTSEAWSTFKSEILRLTHTLRIKGWRRVPLESSCSIDVERLSGALTNCIYVVSPPKELPPVRRSAENGAARPWKPPPKLLLRIYGPNVAHLIDRDSELAILRRLARKRIGPRLLGTFTNGRFEEYFHARPLTPQDLRNPETSKQIAKRMRELHDGITLEERETRAGPFVWQNWDKWVDRCEKIVKWLDYQVLNKANASIKERACSPKPVFICGVEWEKFRAMVDRYRNWLEAQAGGYDSIKQRLIFAHNDTQYGNILRHIPQGDSPLLLPANEHKQLAVIDFEYANANVRGLEFANHFTEWCYNYHDDNVPYALNQWAYPNPSEQARFLRSYICHQPQFSHTLSPVDTPRLGPNPGPTPAASATTAPSRTSSLSNDDSSMLSRSASNFSQDSRTSSVHSSHILDTRRPLECDQTEDFPDIMTDKEVKKLMHETRLWRAANSAFWIAWGIMQAKLPKALAMEVERSVSNEPHHELESLSTSPALDGCSGLQHEQEQPSPLVENPVNGTGKSESEVGREDIHEGSEDEGEEFDYLAYAHERALFFWGDMLQAGLASEKELPEELRAKVKLVDY